MNVREASVCRVPIVTAESTARGTALRVAATALMLVVTACSASNPVVTTVVPDSITQPSTEAPPPSSTTLPPTSQPSATSTTTLTTSSTTGPLAEIVLQVPPAAPPAIDGTLDKGEWDAAATQTLSDGATVHLMRDGETLYVAVATEDIGAVNVVLAKDDAVWILHSSAALGSALYLPVADSWELSHGFTWCCRDTADESGRQALFDEEGWEANIGYAGEPGVVEYTIALPWQGAALAISSIGADADTGFWPAELSSEASDQLLGVPPSERSFNIHEWGRLVAG